MRDFLVRFFAGRYGFDRLGQVLAIASAIFIIIGSILGSQLFTIIAYLLIIWCIYRVLSRKIVYRANENRKFGELCRYVSAYTKRDRKNFKYLRCPNCKRTIKVPRHRGKIIISCPHCRNEFTKKT